MPFDRALREELERGAAALGIPLSPDQLDRLGRYFNLLKTPPLPVNISSISEDREILTLHFFDALAVAGELASAPPSTIIDVGAGNGVPGLVLKLLWPPVGLWSVEAKQRVCAVLRDFARVLEIRDGWEIAHGRAEELAHDRHFRERFEVGTARALAELRVAAELILPLVKVGGSFLAMKGPRVDEELERGLDTIELLGGEISEVHRLDLPGLGGKRAIVRVQKVSSTPEKYPRRYSAIRRSPPKCFT